MLKLFISLLTLMFGLSPLPREEIAAFTPPAENIPLVSTAPDILASPPSTPGKIEVLNTNNGKILSVGMPAAEHGQPFVPCDEVGGGCVVTGSDETVFELFASPNPDVLPLPLPSVYPCKILADGIPCVLESPPADTSPLPQPSTTVQNVPRGSISPCGDPRFERPCPLPIDPGDGVELVNPPIRVKCPPETHPATGMPCVSL